jgi:sulfide:quinone oxidoreductase
VRGAAPHRVLIAGAGVAGLEALLALRDLAGEGPEITVVAPEREFTYRPLAVAELFEVGEANRFERADMLGALGAARVEDALAAVEPERRLARTAAGRKLRYDALLVACGARPRESLPGALTFRGGEDLEVFRALLDDLTAGRIRRIAFAVPGGAGWQLPLYELALMTRAEAQRHGRPDAELTLLTPEEDPLGIFGRPASAAIRGLLKQSGIELVTSVHPVGVEPGALVATTGVRVAADRVVTLPRLEGPRIDGLPQDGEGFILTDLYGAVPGLAGVYAAGDAAAQPIKQGGLAAQQADAVAEVIAAQAGAPIVPRPYRPVLRGLLLTGAEPRFLRAEVTGGRGETSTAAAEALWWPPAKIAGRYLGPYLASRAGIALEQPPSEPGAVEVEVEL